MRKNIIIERKYYFVLMVFLCLAVWGLCYIFILKPQVQAMARYRMEKNQVEYDYMKLKSSGGLIANITEAINKAAAKTEGYSWLMDASDPNLALYDHVDSLGEKSRLVLLEMMPVEKSGAEAERASEKYYVWKVTFAGHFAGIVAFIRELESSQKFLRIESLEIGPGDDGKSVFTVTLRGIKKLE